MTAHSARLHDRRMETPNAVSDRAAIREFMAFGPVHLDVVNNALSAAWWQEVVGLQQIREPSDSTELGIAGQSLVVLHETARSPVRRGFAGLYHLAINLPDEAAFAQTLARLMASGISHSTTDHVVAKSIYLSDPDGIGLELTVELVERVRSISWPPTEPQPEIIDSDGKRRHGLEPLDIAEVLAKLPNVPLPVHLPVGTRVGHVHLKVPDLRASFGFYRNRMGLRPNNYAPVIGYGDLGTGDFRVHRVALNTWTGVGLPQRPADMAGMSRYTLVFRSAARLTSILSQVEHVEIADNRYLVKDAAGNQLELGIAT